MVGRRRTRNGAQNELTMEDERERETENSKVMVNLGWWAKTKEEVIGFPSRGKEFQRNLMG